VHASLTVKGLMNVTVNALTAALSALTAAPSDFLHLQFLLKGTLPQRASPAVSGHRPGNPQRLRREGASTATP
jgi:hypothetical protein